MISIVVPIYNSDKYLYRCLNSIYHQTFEDFEVIMIDDGSTDDSATICQNFAEKDNRFHYHYTQNRGPSHAKNLGISKAEGDYLMFMDSDDEILDICLQCLHSEIKYREIQYDWVISGITYCSIDGTVQKDMIPERKYYNSCSTFDFINMFGCDLINFCVDKLYKKEIIEKNELMFDENSRLGEDTRFNLAYCKFVHCVNVVPNSFYIYYQYGTSSLSGTINSDKFSSLIRICDDALETFGHTTQLDKIVNQRILRAGIAVIQEARQIPTQQRIKITGLVLRSDRFQNALLCDNTYITPKYKLFLRLKNPILICFIDDVLARRKRK